MKTNWFRERRLLLNLSQEDLASKLQVAGFDITRSTISHWENGRYNIPLENPEFRRELANIFRFSIPEMLLLAGYEINTAYSEQAQRAANIIDQLPDDDKQLALNVLEQFLLNRH